MQSDLDQTRNELANVKNIINSFQKDLADQSKKGEESEKNILKRVIVVFKI